MEKVGESIKYQDKIKNLMISYELNSIVKPHAQYVRIESNQIKMNGQESIIGSGGGMDF